MFHKKRTSKGFTAMEAFISIALLSIASGAFVVMLRLMTRDAIGQSARGRSVLASQQFIAYLEPVLNSANEIEVASVAECQFIADLVRNPNYDLAGDQDGDGIINEQDADVDDDASAIMPPGFKWRAGYNLKDDDDNNNGKRDVRIKFYLVGTSLFRDVSHEEEAWGNQVKEISKDILTLTFTYFGSKDTGLKPVDTNNDGVVTAQEIDGTVPPTGSGNNNGIIDTPSELAYITSIRIHVEFDLNKDGRPDATMDSEIAPPFLAIKPLQI